MGNLLWEIKSSYGAYHAAAFPMVISLLAMVYLLKTNPRENHKFLIYELLCFACLIIPGLANLLYLHTGESQQEWMIYGIGASLFFSAYVFAIFLSGFKRKRELTGVLILIALGLQLAIGLDYDGNRIGIVENPYLVEDEVLEIADCLKENSASRVLGPEAVANSLREYNSEISVVYGEGYTYIPTDYEQLEAELTVYKCDSLVLASCYEYEEELTELGFTRIGETKQYHIYKK